MLSSSRIIASPIARKLARDAGQSLESVFGVLDGVGSGPNNRLIQNDIVKALSLLNGRQQSRVEAVAPTPEVIVSPSSIVSYEMDAHEGFLSSLLERSKRSVPHYYLSVDLSLSNLLALRQRLKQTSAQISVTDFILKAAALSMKHVRKLMLIFFQANISCRSPM